MRELAAEMLSGKDVVRRDHAVLHDLLVVIDVVQEEVEGGDALHEAPLEMLPLLGWDDAGDEIERKDPLGALLVAVNVERDALPKEGQVHGASLLIELSRSELVEQTGEFLVVGTQLARGDGHLVEKAVGIVALQHAAQENRTRRHPASLSIQMREMGQKPPRSG